MVRDDQLDGAFCAAIWVCGADGAVLGDGNHVGHAGCIAIDGGRRGEDDVGYTVLGHAAQEGDGSADIDAVIFEGLLTRFSNSLEAGLRWC